MTGGLTPATLFGAETPFTGLRTGPALLANAAALAAATLLTGAAVPLAGFAAAPPVGLAEVGLVVDVGLGAIVLVVAVGARVELVVGLPTVEDAGLAKGLGPFDIPDLADIFAELVVEDAPEEPGLAGAPASGLVVVLDVVVVLEETVVDPAKGFLAAVVDEVGVGLVGLDAAAVVVVVLAVVVDVREVAVGLAGAGLAEVGLADMGLAEVGLAVVVFAGSTVFGAGLALEASGLAPTEVSGLLPTALFGAVTAELGLELGPVFEELLITEDDEGLVVVGLLDAAAPVAVVGTIFFGVVDVEEVLGPVCRGLDVEEGFVYVFPTTGVFTPVFFGEPTSVFFSASFFTCVTSGTVSSPTCTSSFTSPFAASAVSLISDARSFILSKTPSSV